MRWTGSLVASLLVFSLAIPANAEELALNRRPSPGQPECLAPPAIPEVKSAPPPATPAPLPPGTPAATTEPPVSFSPLESAALGDDFVAVSAPGYIDPAQPLTHFRFRFDAGYSINRPDRAEFIYAKCGCFGFDAPGPILPERSVDVQETAFYFEYAATKQFSAFLELPVRYINPEVNSNEAGVGDLRFGFKYAMLYDEDRILTFQLKNYVPSGNARLGLGTDHFSIEPSLLLWRKLGERAALHSQIGDWISLGGTDFAGNVFFYGAGLSYQAWCNDAMKVSPVVEMLGWTVMSGRETDLAARNPSVDASGTTIVNAKVGARVEGRRSDFYVGYGHALTSDVWYRDIVRVEYRLKF